MRTTVCAAVAAVLALLAIGAQAAPHLGFGTTCQPPTTRLDGEMYASQEALEQWVKAQAATFKRPALATYTAAYSNPELEAQAKSQQRADRLSLDVAVLDEGVIDPFFGMLVDFKQMQTFRVVMRRDCGDEWYVASALRTATESGRPVGMGAPGMPVDG